MIFLDSSRALKSGDPTVPGILAGRREAMDRAGGLVTGRSPQAVFVMAGPGIGKSLFLQAVTERIADAATVERIHASPSLQHVPFGILAPYTSGLTGEDTASPVAVLRAVWTSFQQLKEERGLPVVLVVDDAHLLDESSAAVLVDMVAAGWSSVMVAARPRPGLPQQMNQLWYDGLAERIDLHPLDRQQLAEVLADSLGCAVQASVISAFWQATEGNPFLIGCLLKDARTEGTIVQRNGRWHLGGPLPADGRELSSYVEREVARRSREEQAALRLIALAGSVNRGAVEELCGAAVVRALVDQHLVADNGGYPSELKLRYPIVGEAIRNQVTVSRSLHLRLKLQRESDAAPVSAAAQLRDVEWSLECGQPVADTALLQAAITALKTGSNEVAARLAGKVATGHSRALASAVAARARFNMGEYAVARALLEQARTGLSPAEAVAVAMLRMAALMAGGLSPEETFPPDAGLPAGELPRGQDPASDVLHYALTAEKLADNGKLQEALDYAAKAAAAASSVDNTLYFFEEFVVVRAVVVYLGMGEWAAAEQELDRYTERHCGGHGLFDAAMDALRGYSYIRQGKLERARRILLPAADSLQLLDPLQLYRFCASLAFYATARMGDKEQARRLATDLAAGSHLDQPGISTRASAYLSAGKEHLERDGTGLAALREHCSVPDVSARPLVLLECLLLRTELEDRSLMPTIAEVAAGVDGPWAAGLARLAQLWHTADGDALLNEANGLAAAGLVSLARKAYLRAGTLLQDAGDVRRYRQSVSLLQKCDGILGRTHQPSGAKASAPGVRLTRRERDIAVLAAQGLADKDIAQRLMVSVRTVEGHLYRTYVKLGVRSREELLPVLPQPAE